MYDTDLLFQIRNVLRLKKGDVIVLCNGKNQEAECVLVDFFEKKIFCSVRKIHELEIIKRSVTLYCSLIKRELFDLVAQKTTEIGIKKIVPIICRRTVKQAFKKERIQKIMKEASEQSGRGEVPELGDSMMFRAAFQEATVRNEKIFLFDSSGTHLNQKSFGKYTHTALFIGPEGGWEKEELDQGGRDTLSLGPLTLRVETAAIIASYIALTN